MARSATRQIFSTLQRRDPTESDDASSGYLPDSLWKNLLTGVTYTCRNPRSSAAWWEQTDPVPDPPAPTPTPEPIPQPTLDQVELPCAESVRVGDCVCLVASGITAAGTDYVATADPYDRDRMPAIGIAVEKIDATTCLVQREGFLDGIYTNLTPGETYNVSAEGRLSIEAPLAANNGESWAQKMGTAWSATRFEVKPSTSLKQTA